MYVFPDKRVSGRALRGRPQGRKATVPESGVTYSELTLQSFPKKQNNGTLASFLKR
jgi:hypothetical protein